MEAGAEVGSQVLQSLMEVLLGPQLGGKQGRGERSQCCSSGP